MLTTSDKALLNRIEASLWSQLGAVIDDSVIEPVPSDAQSPLGPAAAEALRAWDADVLVTTDVEQLRHSSSDQPVVGMRNGCSQLTCACETPAGPLRSDGASGSRLNPDGTAAKASSTTGPPSGKSTVSA